MKKPIKICIALLLSGTVCALVGGFVVRLTTSHGGAPRVVLSSTVLDIGHLRADEQISRSVAIGNSGTVPLRIESVTPECGCTVAKLDKRVVAPGGEAHLSVSFNSHGFSRRIEKVVLIRTNDPRSSNTEVTLKGYVDVGIRVESPTLFLGSGRDSEQLHGTLWVLRDAGRNTGKPRIKGDASHFLVEVGEWESYLDAQRLPMQFRVSGSALKPGRYQKDLHIMFSTSEELPISIIFEVEPPVWATPSSLSFVIGVADSERMARAVQLRWQGKTPKFELPISTYGLCHAEQHDESAGKTSADFTVSISNSGVRGFDVIRIPYSLPGDNQTFYVTVPVTFAGQGKNR